ncbi:50S ribosomal protein L11 methyltransferase [Desulfofalx alkaliphila]|uniref:50S ribosomal protein L11 methyltransferase n=1 Tax=Desulfofalx alkaliphila TaxID=105483 RepID=UPI0004E24014|nr:50S ribosomal protein L11 methyltransferase [Desulfofalx alkaliphila]
MKWLEVSVHTPSDAVELVSLIFEELGVGGVAIEDPAIIYRYIESGVWDHWDFSEDELKNAKAVVKAYLPPQKDTKMMLEQLQQRLKNLDIVPFPKIYTREIDEEDWANAWKAFYKPLYIGRRFLVKPSWEEVEDGHKRIVLDLDPGMAFGCGSHATTAMCLEYLEDLIVGGEEVCDVGTGSGILAIAAAKAGASSVLAVDLDEVAVEVAKKNVQLNGVAAQVQVKRGNLLEVYRQRADLIIANIVADVIIQLAPDAYQALKGGGHFIASGIIKDRAGEVQSVLQQTGFKVQAISNKGEWVAYLLGKE